MDYRYGELPLDLLRALLTFDELLKLFLDLATRTGGDVEKALAWLRELQRRGIIDPSLDLEAFRAELEKQGIVAKDGEGRLGLTGGGERRIRRSALEEIFSSLAKTGAGFHSVPKAGTGAEPLPETRAWEFGDDLARLDGIRSVANAARRDPEELALKPDDLEVFEVEHQSSCATAIAIDVSHSMILYGEDRFTPAKKVALALTELILQKYPKDTIDVVLFGDEARAVPLAELSRAKVGPFHTNTKEGIELARGLLMRRRSANRQLFLVTDGKPSCIREGGRLYKNPFGLDLKIVNRTLEAAERCRRDGIQMTTFMVATDPSLVDFVETLTQVAKGRAYYASPNDLATFVFRDYIRNRKKLFRG
ncbi:MAG TPA: VWA domain-containing protein [Thermoanaerobaculia bacterium]|nr:VWA domain-containing protein [Thermoanaerobaculia bacterium]